MPFGGAQIIAQLIDFDEGDESWYGTWWDMVEYLQTRLLSFKFTDNDNRKDKCVLELNNDDFALYDNPVFTKGQKLIITWGWPGQMAPPRRMVVVKVEGGSRVRVVLHCTLVLLDNEKKYRHEENITHSDFVRMVAGEHGYSGPTLDIDETTEVFPDITQPKWMTDARMLKQLARKNGFQFYVDAAGLHWHKPRTDIDPVRTFLYKIDPGRGSILEPPEIEANLTRGVAKVRVLARDPITREPVIGEASDENADMTSLGEEQEFGNPDGNLGKREARVTRVDERPGGYMTQTQADAEAKARYRETAKNRYKMKLKVIGDARMPAKCVVDIWGVSESMDGLYYVKQVDSMISDGKFTQTLHMRKDALREVKATKKKEQKGNRNTKGGKSKKQVSGEVLIGEFVVRYDKNGKAIPTVIYTDSEGQVGAVESPSWELLASLPDHTLEILAQQSAQSVLPDA